MNESPFEQEPVRELLSFTPTGKYCKLHSNSGNADSAVCDVCRIQQMQRNDRAPETYEQQKKDSDHIFNMITGNFAFDNFEQAEAAVVMLFVRDFSYSRSGISFALKRLEWHYARKSP